MLKKTPDLTPNEATILRIIYARGQEDAWALTKSIGISKKYGLRILGSLKHKGLIRVRKDCDGLWIYASTKGKQIAGLIWPEVRLMAVNY